MSRGIHRVIIQLGQEHVNIRAQSKTLRGTAFTVGHATADCKELTPSARKAAIAELVIGVLSPKVGGS